MSTSRAMSSSPTELEGVPSKPDCEMLQCTSNPDEVGLFGVPRTYCVASLTRPQERETKPETMPEKRKAAFEVPLSGATTKRPRKAIAATSSELLPLSQAGLKIETSLPNVLTSTSSTSEYVLFCQFLQSRRCSCWGCERLRRDLDDGVLQLSTYSLTDIYGRERLVFPYDLCFSLWRAQMRHRFPDALM